MSADGKMTCQAGRDGNEALRCQNSELEVDLIFLAEPL